VYYRKSEDSTLSIDVCITGSVRIHTIYRCVYYRKREEKMKRFQSQREQQLTREKQMRADLQKRLREKEEMTIKQREERLKEEQEKQRIR